MSRLLCAENITKSYGTGEERHKVLNGVTVRIERGEFTAVMGPSGSGKSTLLYALGGMDPADSGKVIFDDLELSGLSDSELSAIRRKRMGFVFQQPSFLKNLNLLDNIILPAARDNRKNRTELIRKAYELMAQMGIDGLCQRDSNQVSGGQLQRAGICRALINNPEILLGDEPTGALNSKAAEEVMNLFSEINGRGTAVLLVTHDANVAARAGRVIFMRDGEVAGELLFPAYAPAGHEKRVEKIARRMQSIGI